MLDDEAFNTDVRPGFELPPKPDQRTYQGDPTLVASDSTLTQRLADELSRWYQADWEQAFMDDRPPSLHDVVEAIEPIHREVVTEALSKIDDRYRDRFEQHRKSRISSGTTSHGSVANGGRATVSQRSVDEPTIGVDSERTRGEDSERTLADPLTSPVVAASAVAAPHADASDPSAESPTPSAFEQTLAPESEVRVASAVSEGPATNPPLDDDFATAAPGTASAVPFDPGVTLAPEAFERPATGDEETAEANVPEAMPSDPKGSKGSEKISVRSGKGSEASPSKPMVRSGSAAVRGRRTLREDEPSLGDPTMGGGAALEFPGYEIVDLLGEGGMGRVYLARQSGIERPVALKMIIGGSMASQAALDRFDAEARAVGKFQHENIVRIYDYGHHQGSPYFALEFVDGSDLSKRINGEPMDPRSAAEIAVCLAEAMQYSHDHDIIHRDLKPANVLMTADGKPKVTDFGLAKELKEDAGLSMDGVVIGTPAYMAPEQAQGLDTVAAPADIYGLGALLYCMLTGRPPFQSTQAMKTLEQVINKDPIKPKELQPTVPTDLQTICMKAMHKDIDKRYKSAGAMAADLQCFLDDKPISARPVSRTERVVRWCRRNPKMATASGLASALALTVMIGGPVAAWIINGQKERVVAEKDRADKNAEIALGKEQQAIAAREVANENAEAARVQEKLAIDALKSVTFEVQNRLQGDSRMRPLRTKLLDTVRGGLERMEVQGKDVDAHNMIAAGIAVRKGDLNLEVGRVASAMSEYEKCKRIFDELKARDGLPSEMHNVSKIHRLMGDAAHAMGDLNRANAEYTQSLEQRRLWFAEDDRLPVKKYLAEILSRTGRVASERGELERAESLLSENLKTRQEIHAAAPEAGTHYSDLLQAKMLLAKTVFQSGRIEEGISLMDEAAEGQRESLNWNRSASNRINAALFDGVRARMRLYGERWDEADAIYRNSVAEIRSVLADHPFEIAFMSALDRSLYGWAVVLERTGKDEDADATMAEAIEIRESLLEIEPENLVRRLNLVSALARGDEVQRASELANELAPKIKTDSGMLYHLACGFALIAEATRSPERTEQPERTKQTEQTEQSKRYATLAIDTLRESIANGFYRETDLNHDPDLNAIRDHERFRELLRSST